MNSPLGYVPRLFMGPVYSRMAWRMRASSLANLCGSPFGPSPPFSIHKRRLPMTAYPARAAPALALRYRRPSPCSLGLGAVLLLGHDLLAVSMLRRPFVVS